jgi:hypothetical protein
LSIWRTLRAHRSLHIPARRRRPRRGGVGGQPLLSGSGLAAAPTRLPSRRGRVRRARSRRQVRRYRRSSLRQENRADFRPFPAGFFQCIQPCTKSSLSCARFFHRASL